MAAVRRTRRHRRAVRRSRGRLRRRRLRHRRGLRSPGPRPGGRAAAGCVAGRQRHRAGRQRNAAHAPGEDHRRQHHRRLRAWRAGQLRAGPGGDNGQEDGRRLAIGRHEGHGATRRGRHPVRGVGPYRQRPVPVPRASGHLGPVRARLHHGGRRPRGASHSCQRHRAGRCDPRRRGPGPGHHRACGGPRHRCAVRRGAGRDGRGAPGHAGISADAQAVRRAHRQLPGAAAPHGRCAAGNRAGALGCHQRRGGARWQRSRGAREGLVGRQVHHRSRRHAGG